MYIGCLPHDWCPLLCSSPPVSTRIIHSLSGLTDALFSAWMSGEKETISLTGRWHSSMPISFNTKHHKGPDCGEHIHNTQDLENASAPQDLWYQRPNTFSSPPLPNSTQSPLQMRKISWEGKWLDQSRIQNYLHLVVRTAICDASLYFDHWSLGWKIWQLWLSISSLRMWSWKGHFISQNLHFLFCIIGPIIILTI